MSKHILIFGAGRSATVLIDYLKTLLVANNWHLTVADSNLQLAITKIGNAPSTRAVEIDIENEVQRQDLIRQADLVISMLPPTLHLPVAIDCCNFKKHLLTASYISDDIRKLAASIKQNGILFLCEMGLDPGIDHMSAMQIIDRLRAEGAGIESFRSHCGGLVAPESDDNPWHYKISWNAANVVKAGSTGAIYKENSTNRFIPYDKLFADSAQVNVPGLGNYAYYPNRDSLAYIPIYGLEDTSLFVRTTLRHPDFCSGWNAIVKAGLTDQQPLKSIKDLTFASWSAPIVHHISEKEKAQFTYLGFFEDTPVPQHLHSSAAILQYLIESRLMLKEDDKDMIVMLHEFIYTVNGKRKELKSVLSVKGENHLHTAMAKTVGLPLGIAAKLLLQNKILLTGLHIPVRKEFYQPVLEELRNEGIAFQEEVTSLP